MKNISVIVTNTKLAVEIRANEEDIGYPDIYNCDLVTLFVVALRGNLFSHFFPALTDWVQRNEA